jgi:predicted nucleic acid-binding Zn ribbon protein
MQEAVSAVMKRLGLEERLWMTTIETEWPELVGEAVAKHTRPGTLESGRLVVFVDSSVWLSEIRRYGMSQMLSNLRNRYGARRVRSVVLRLDPGS